MRNTAKFDEKYQRDCRNDEELVALCRQEWIEDREREPDFSGLPSPLASLHWRGGLPQLRLAQKLAGSDDLVDRQLAADIAGQLGWDQRFADERRALLGSLLEDAEEAVIRAACFALGHGMSQPSMLARLSELRHHPDVRMRRACVSALGGLQSLVAATDLSCLMTDVDADIRNWATFYMSNCTSDERQANWVLPLFVERIEKDTDQVVRGESLRGIWERKNRALARAMCRQMLADEEADLLVFETAGDLADPSLLPLLMSWQERGDQGYLEEAIAACRASLKKELRMRISALKQGASKCRK